MMAFSAKQLAGSLFCLLLFVITSNLPAAQPIKLEWKTDAGLHFQLTDSDLSVSNETGNNVFSMQKILQDEEKQFNADSEETARELLGDDPPEFAEPIATHSVTLQPLSVAGTIISYQQSSGGDW